jgi:glutamine amidotransferase-like uncharacterized protein
MCWKGEGGGVGRYCEKADLPAIVRCEVGRGAAVLSGVHFEFAPEDLMGGNDEIAQKILETNERRIQFVREIFQNFGI